MRYLFAILALSAAAVLAVDGPDEVAGDEQPRHKALISSGTIKYAAKDHPPPQGPDGKIVGTGKIGKSVFTSPRELVEGTGNRPDPNETRTLDIIRESHVTDQGLEAIADAGTLTTDGHTLPAGHVSIAIPKGHEMTVDEIAKKMDNLQANAVRAKGETRANQMVAKANAQPTKPLAEIKAEVDSENPPRAKQQPKKSKKSKKSGGGAAESPTAGGDATTNCKRDGSFCTLVNRRKKTSATGKNAASTVTRKTAGNPKSRKAATHATTAASKKPTTRSKTRLASSKAKAITGKKTVKGGTGKPTRSKKDRKASSKQSTGSKKGVNTQAAAAAGKWFSIKKAGTTKKAGASGKGASSTKATTTKLRKPATGKKVPTAKKAVTMARTKSTTRQKHVAKPAGGSSKKQSFTAPSASKKLSSGVVGNAAKLVAPAAKSTKKRVHRRELTMNRPRMVYEAVQEHKRGLTQESMLDELD